MRGVDEFGRDARRAPAVDQPEAVRVGDGPVGEAVGDHPALHRHMAGRRACVASSSYQHASSRAVSFMGWSLGSRSGFPGPHVRLGEVASPAGADDRQPIEPPTCYPTLGRLDAAPASVLLTLFSMTRDAGTDTGPRPVPRISSGRVSR